MKVRLMFPDRDFELEHDRPWQAAALVDDLALHTLFATMAGDDPFVLAVVERALVEPLDDPVGIRHRQAVLRDCEAHPDVVGALHELALEAIALRKRRWFGTVNRYPAAVLSSARQLMQSFVGVLEKLRAVADASMSGFESDGFRRFFSMLRSELSDDYFVILDEHLRELRFRKGTSIGASLGAGNKCCACTLRRSDAMHANRFMRWFGAQAPSRTFQVHERDEAGMRALSQLQAQGIDLAADALGQAVEHVSSFFTMLRTELAFYLGGLRLIEVLRRTGRRFCYPQIAEDDRRWRAEGLYDVGMALRSAEPIVPSDLRADGRPLIVVTGANGGGKSTFLRSVGLAQLMMQAGMIVAADVFCGSVARAVFTHYRREEDASMRSGKFEEELARIGEIADRLAPGSLVLFNESFASTNEREGSEIAGEIVRALLDRGIRVVFVTHMYALASGLLASQAERSLFLRAGRANTSTDVIGGATRFRLEPGEPLDTSFGADLYARIFDTEPAQQHPAASMMEPNDAPR